MPRDADLDTLSVSGIVHPFDGRRCDYAVPVGITIAEIIELIQPDQVLREHGLVFIGEHLVQRKYWHLVRPKAGSMVSIRLVPTGGGFGRMFALIAIAVLAIGVTVLLGPAGFAILPAFAAGLVGAAVAIGGSMALNLLMPPPVPKLSKNYGQGTPSYAITGQRNRMDPWGKVPFVGGTFKITPPYAAQPFREAIGHEVDWRCVFAISHGPIKFLALRIGESDLMSYQGIDFEIRRGFWTFQNQGNWNASSGVYPTSPTMGDTYTVSVAGSTDGQSYVVGETITFNSLAASTSFEAWDRDQQKPFKLFPNDVFEDDLNDSISYGSPVIRTSQANADHLVVQIVFDKGLAHIENNPPGRRASLTAAIRIEQKPATGAGDWTIITDQNITGRETTPIFWGYGWSTSDFGTHDPIKQYDVRVTRLNPNFDEDRNFGQFTWFSMRTASTAVIPVPGIAMIAMRIKATEQLSGALDEFNLDVGMVARKWNGSQWNWEHTGNPAAIYRHMLQHPARVTPATDAQLDLSRLQYWSQFCDTKSFVWNGVFESKGSLFDALIDISRIGHAVPTLRDIKYSVVIDEPKTAAVRLFSPRNSWNYSGEMTHAATPQGYRIGFINSIRNWSTEEVIVYDDGFDATNARRIERVEWPGITDRETAWKEGRYHIAQQRLRREVHKIDADFEHLVCERGDLVALQHDAIAVGLGSMRIKSRTDNGSVVQTITLDSAAIMEAGKSYGIRARRVVSGAQQTDLYAVNTVAGEQLTLTLSSPQPTLANAPAVGDLISFGEYSTETRRVLVRDIEPHQDLTATLTLIDEAPGVHTAGTGSIPPWDPGLTVPFALPSPIVIKITSNVLVMMRNASRGLAARVVFSLKPTGIEGSRLYVIFRPTGTSGQWQTPVGMEETPRSVTINGVESGETYDFRLAWTHPNYLSSPITQLNGVLISGRDADPVGLVNLTIAAVGGGVTALLRWDPIAQLDIAFGGHIVFRFCHLPIETANWGESTSIGEAVAGDQTHVYLPLKPGTYIVRVYDAQGTVSSTESITSDLKQMGVLTYTNITFIQEHPTFSGTKTGVEVIDNKLQLQSGVLSGTYSFANTMDLGVVTKFRLMSTTWVLAVGGGLIDGTDANEMWDSQEDIDGTASAPVDAQIWGKFTDDDPGGSPTWGGWRRIDTMEVEARAVGMLQCRLIRESTAFNIQVSNIWLDADSVA